MLGLGYSLSYLKERFTMFPWVFAPIYFLVLFLDSPTAFPLQWIALTLSLVFFRSFDDYYCRELDLETGKDRRYLGFTSREHLFMTLVFFVAALGSALLAWSPKTLFALAMVIVVSVILYKTLHGKWIEFISLLKYPVLLFAINSKISLPILGAFMGALILFEFLENKPKNYIVFLIPVLTKIYMEI